MGRRILILLLFAACAFIGVYFTNGKSDECEAYLDKIEVQKREEEAAKGNFDVYHGSRRERNWWDLGTAGLVVIGSSFALAAIWLRKR